MGNDLPDQAVPVARVHLGDEAAERVVPLRPAERGERHADPLQRQVVRIDAVYQAAEIVGEDDPAMQRLLRVATQLTGASAACFALVAERRSLVRATLGIDRDAAAALWPLDRCVVGEDRLFSGAELTRHEAHLEQTLQRRGLCAQGYAGIPLRMPNGLVVGVLSILWAQPRVPTTQLRSALTDMGALVEDWILLRSASIIDVLTGLFNRRYFEELVAREWRRTLRYTRPISVLMIDIDHFKALNDSLGHEAGDGALAQVAEVLRDHFRRGGDMIARYGGEEFVVVMPETDAAAAMARGRSACKAVEDAQLTHPTSPYEAVTVSIGAATASTEEDRRRGPIALLGKADQALYEAKRRGRNRVQFDPGAVYRQQGASS